MLKSIIQDELKHMSSVDVATRVIGCDPMSVLRDMGIIRSTAFSEGQTEMENAIILKRMRRLSWGVLAAVRLDDYQMMVASSAALAAVCQLTQHNWSGFEQDVIDVHLLLVQVQLHCPGVVRDISIARDAYLISTRETLPSVSLPEIIIEERRELLGAIHILGLPKRLERDRPHDAHVH